jgi:hypothetical protein
MKTSNKLLLTGLGVVVGSLLTYNVALRAEYRQGTYKDRFRNYQTLPLADFDQVQVRSRNLSVKLVPGPFAVRVSKNAAPNVTVTRVGRELVVVAGPALNNSWAEGNVVLIACPDLRRLHTVANWTSVKGFALDSLTVQQDQAGEVELDNNKIGFLGATAGQSAGSKATLTINATNRIQAAELAIRSQGELALHDVSIPQFHCQFSDSARATITGRSLGMMQR